MSGNEALPRVSVIIPTHNRSKLLRVAVESVLAQTYPAIEIIVVDDGSTDDTAAVIAEYAGRVTYIEQANAGVAAARNTGFRASSGEFINFLDDDDTFLPTKIERQVAVLEAQPEAGLVHCGYHHVDEEGTVLDTTGVLPEGHVLKELICESFLTVHSPLIRRQCLEQVGLFDEVLPWTADWDLWLRIALAGYPFACVQEPLCTYLVHPVCMTSDIRTLELQTLEVLDRVFANPRLPKDVSTLEDEVYSAIHLWYSCQYCAVHRWDDAQRSVAEALALRPQLLAQPDELLDAVYHIAMGVRIGDPVRLLDDFFAHLPPQADSLRPHGSRLISKIMVDLALRAYAAGNIVEARRRLTEAIALYPPVLERTQDFLDMVCYHAMNPPMTAPLKYIDTVFRNLPAGAKPLSRLRSRTLREVNLGRAFRDYAASRYPLVIRSVLRALWQHPAYLTNKGVMSILMRSLFGFFTTTRSAKGLTNGATAPGVQ
jgi:glycosyltransferase involved in cell wall biosynthesis